MSAVPTYGPLIVWGHDGTDPIRLPRSGAQAQRGAVNVTTDGGFDGSGGGGTTGDDNYYVEVPCEDADKVTVQVTWFDGTISFDDTGSTMAVAFCNESSDHVKAYDETATGFVTDTSITPTGPAGSAAGTELIVIDTAGKRRCRIFFEAKAAGDVLFAIWGNE